MLDKKNFILTFDVERYSFNNNNYIDSIIPSVAEQISILLDLLDKKNAKATFFFTARFAEKSPKTLLLVKQFGHEVGCHGYNHFDFYDSLCYDEQVKYLKKSKNIIENIIGSDVKSFRAPSLRINKQTVKALETVGFKHDSSVASQRFDGPLTSGALKKTEWLFAPRGPYNPSSINPFSRGESKIREFPISSFFWAMTGTHLRLSPMMTGMLLKLLDKEASFKNIPIVFLIHPNEFINFTRQSTSHRNNWFSDNLRHMIKMKNLGDKCYKLFNGFLEKLEEKEFIITSIKSYEKNNEY